MLLEGFSSIDVLKIILKFVFTVLEVCVNNLVHKVYSIT